MPLPRPYVFTPGTPFTWRGCSWVYHAYHHHRSRTDGKVHMALDEVGYIYSFTDTQLEEAIIQPKEEKNA